MAKHISHRGKLDKILLLRCLVILPFVFCSIIFQVSFFDIFGVTPLLTLSLVSGIGFLFGEKAGGVYGLCAGFLLDLLGGYGFSISPLFYMLAGYLFGYMLRVFLQKNFVSFIVYSSMLGLIKALLTMGYYTLKTDSFNIITIFSKIMLPEFFAFMIFCPVSYFLCLGVEKITGKMGNK